MYLLLLSVLCLFSGISAKNHSQFIYLYDDLDQGINLFGLYTWWNRSITMQLSQKETIAKTCLVLKVKQEDILCYIKLMCRL